MSTMYWVWGLETSVFLLHSHIAVIHEHAYATENLCVYFWPSSNEWYITAHVSQCKHQRNVGVILSSPSLASVPCPSGVGLCQCFFDNQSLPCVEKILGRNKLTPYHGNSDLSGIGAEFSASFLDFHQRLIFVSILPLEECTIAWDKGQRGGLLTFSQWYCLLWAAGLVPYPLPQG